MKRIDKKKDIQLRLQIKLNGKIEVKTKFGFIFINRYRNNRDKKWKKLEAWFRSSMCIFKILS